MNSLTEILAERHGVATDALAAADRIRAEKGGQIGEILVQQKAISEEQLMEALAAQFDLPFWPRLPLIDIDPTPVAAIPIHFLKKHSLVPINCRKAPLMADCGLNPPSSDDSNRLQCVFDGIQRLFSDDCLDFLCHGRLLLI